jgi:molybdopterin-containing oxidoreductase family membrane subunit
MPWCILLGVGVYAGYLCLTRGLYQTNMDNRLAFGLWIYLDLTVIAFGAGAFFTGFLLYILKREELKSLINSAVVLGFICYSGAIAILMLDVGQPLRAWFTFWHPNVHSMLTEVTFCITCYLLVLFIEYLPLILKSKMLRRIPSFLVFEFELHKLMYVLAGVGTFLSFFHQGSLGGLYGVLRGRPFAFREGFAIWPSTFILFILSALAVGPSFLLIVTWLVSRITGKTLVKDEVLRFLGRLSGEILIYYVLFKAVDTLVWINGTARSAGFHPFEFYARKPFGTWILFTEIELLGLLPAIMMLSKRVRANTGLLVFSAVLTCAGVALNRFVLTIQTLALPTLPFDELLSYVPSWQEVSAFAAVVAYGVLIFSFSFRYLPLYPHERELNNV